MNDSFKGTPSDGEVIEKNIYEGIILNNITVKKIALPIHFQTPYRKIEKQVTINPPFLLRFL